MNNYIKLLVENLFDDSEKDILNIDNNDEQVYDIQKKFAYKYYPETKDDLIKCIQKEIELHGLGTEKNLLNLNIICTSNITDMSSLFSDLPLKKYNLKYIDISEWNTSSVTDMSYMFFGTEFNGDISKWDVSSVTEMVGMFKNSDFNGDISKWDVSSVIHMQNMFQNSYFDGDISDWNIKSVENINNIFIFSSFNGDVSKWIDKMKPQFKRELCDEIKVRLMMGSKNPNKIQKILRELKLV